MSMIISINGNIGSGKTDFIKKIKQEVSDNSLENIIVLEDHIDQSFKIYDNNMLQLMLLITRFKSIGSIVKTNPGAIIICESCLVTDIEMFIKMLYNNNKDTSYLFQALTDWFSDLCKDLPEQKSIYLYSTPEDILVKMLRISNNSTIDLDCLTKRHKYYQKIFTDNDNVIIKINIDRYSIPINNSINFEYNRLVANTVKLFQDNNLNKAYYLKYNMMYNEEIINNFNVTNNYLFMTTVVFIVLFIYVF